MEGARSAMINGGSFSQRPNSGRLIPKRGQVKVAIVGVLLHSFSSVFSASSRRGGCESSDAHHFS
ncbi:hypothetical protein DVH24_017143 [Malus domestica]|uniref:Uncharacterized protein n=1 Tax=Malus domestica TaxID=3750 RepID=A0A498IS55_MALDO|nr:hypothetical protein DVH24_017143 [Malus domestica]